MLSCIHGPFSSSLLLPPPFIRGQSGRHLLQPLRHVSRTGMIVLPISPHFLEALPPRLIDVVHALAYMLQWALHGLGVKSIHLAPRKMAGHTYLVYRTSAGKMHAPVPSYRSYCRFHKFFFYP